VVVDSDKKASWLSGKELQPIINSVHLLKGGFQVFHFICYVRFSSKIS